MALSCWWSCAMLSASLKQGMITERFISILLLPCTCDLHGDIGLQIGNIQCQCAGSIGGVRLGFGWLAGGGVVPCHAICRARRLHSDADSSADSWDGLAVDNRAPDVMLVVDPGVSAAGAQILLSGDAQI